MTRPHQVSPPLLISSEIARREITGKVPARWLACLLASVGSASPGRGQWQCPAHHDSSPSLSLDTSSSTGAALLFCHAGCTVDQILAALDLRRAHLFTPPELTPAEHAKTAALRWRLRFPPLERARHPVDAGFRLEQVHVYGDRFRLLRYRHPTSGAKAVEWERHDRRSWIPGLGGTPIAALPLYREAEARMAVGAGELLVLVESESSVDALCHAGIYATTWAGGATTPNLDRLALLRRHDQLLLVPDNDPPGLACAVRIRAVLPDVQLLLPPPEQDARDLLDQAGPEVFTAREQTGAEL